MRVALFVFTLMLLPLFPVMAQNSKPAGYTDKGSKVEFVFGDQLQIVIGGLSISLEKRRKEIITVSLAGDFNGWKPNQAGFLLKQEGLLYKLVLPKSMIGKTGETHQFKFVINNKYWVEPPANATNRFKGADGNVNFTIRL
jgi:hypothetical protein